MSSAGSRRVPRGDVFFNVVSRRGVGVPAVLPDDSPLAVRDAGWRGGGHVMGKGVTVLGDFNNGVAVGHVCQGWGVLVGRRIEAEFLCEVVGVKVTDLEDNNGAHTTKDRTADFRVVDELSGVLVGEHKAHVRGLAESRGEDGERILGEVVEVEWIGETVREYRKIKATFHARAALRVSPVPPGGGPLSLAPVTRPQHDTAACHSGAQHAMARKYVMWTGSSGCVRMPF